MASARPPMTPPPLLFRNLHKRLGPRGVLSGVDLVLEPSQVAVLLGPNGAGKTTLIRCASGRLRPDRGEALLHGRDPRHAAARRRLGLVPQDLALFLRLTVRENLEVFARLLRVPRRQVRDRVARALDSAGLADRANQAAQALSGGLRRRLNLVASLLHEPDVLLLDEPTVGVDVDAVTRIEALLRAERARGTTVLLITHDLELTERLADRVIVMAEGKVRADGAPRALIDQTFAQRLNVSVTLPAPPPAALAERLADWGFEPRSALVYASRCPRERVEALLHALDAHGVRARELRMRDPTLVDVYESVLRDGRAA